MSSRWKYLFRGITLAGAGLVCVCFWLPMISGWVTVRSPAYVVHNKPSLLATLFFPFLIAAFIVMISLLQWLLRGPRFLKVARIAVFVVAILAMLYVAAMCAWFGWSEWSFQHFQAQSLFNGSVGALANAGISSIAFAAIACYQFRRCHPEDRLLLAVLALGLVCLSFFANVSFAFGWDVECYGLYLAILGGATTCLGALGELLAAAKVRRRAADAVDDAPRGA